MDFVGREFESEEHFAIRIGELASIGLVDQLLHKELAMRLIVGSRSRGVLDGTSESLVGG